MTTTARTPEDVNRLFEARVNAGDLEGVVALYEPDATLVTADAGTLVGHAAIRGYFEGMIGMQGEIDMGEYRVVPLDDGLAVMSHDWRANVASPDGQRMVLTGKATEVARRQPDGRWLFIFDDPNHRD